MNISIINLILGEIVGTAILILLGNGIGYTVNIKKFGLGKISNWSTIFFCWGLAVMAAVVVGNAISPRGVSINPAVATWIFFMDLKASLGFGSAAIIYVSRIFGAFVGAMSGQLILNLLNWRHLPSIEPKSSLLQIHCTVPATKESILANFGYEFVLTCILIATVATQGGFESGSGTIFAGLIVASIVGSLGGATGAAINPARDLGPRIVFALLPLKEKHSSMWGYAWIPVLAPLLAGILIGVINYFV